MKMTTMVVTALMALLAMENAAHAAFEWKNLNADPYAKTRAEAMQRRSRAFKSLGLSKGAEAVALKATENPGTPITLKPGDHLDAMMSGSGGVKEDVTVGITNAAEVWTIPGMNIILPDGCNNWSKQLLVSSDRTAPTTGCVEIRLPALRQGDLGVKGFIAGPGGYDLAHDQCLGLKEGNGSYRPLPDDFGSQTTSVFSDFRRIEAVIEVKSLVPFSFTGKPGTAYTLRLPRIMRKPGWMTDFHLVRALLTREPGTTAAFRETRQFDDTKNSGMVVLSSCYEGGVATMAYDEADISPTAGCQLYLNVPRDAWEGP